MNEWAGGVLTGNPLTGSVIRSVKMTPAYPKGWPTFLLACSLSFSQHIDQSPYFRTHRSVSFATHSALISVLFSAFFQSIHQSLNFCYYFVQLSFSAFIHSALISVPFSAFFQWPTMMLQPQLKLQSILCRSNQQHHLPSTRQAACFLTSWMSALSPSNTITNTDNADTDKRHRHRHKPKQSVRDTKKRVDPVIQTVISLFILRDQFRLINAKASDIDLS